MTLRITILDIAREAGVGRSTVSRALSGDPRCAEATRKKVQKIAEALGYVPDPALSALVGHRERTRTPHSDYNLATLFIPPGNAYEGNILKAFEQHAVRLGYGVDVIDPHDPLCRDPKRLARTLRTRGVRGVLWGWLLDPAYLDAFPWQQFAHVGFLLPVVRPDIHRVRDDSFRTMLDAMEQALAGGARRPALALATSPGSDNDRYQQAAYLLACQEAGIPAQPVWKSFENKSIRQWVKTNQPDLVIGNVAGIYWQLNAAGLTPRLPYLNLLHSSDNPEHPYDGFDCQEDAIGKSLVDLLHRELRHNEMGLTSAPMTHLVRRIARQKLHASSA